MELGARKKDHEALREKSPGDIKDPRKSRAGRRGEWARKGWEKKSSCNTLCLSPAGQSTADWPERPPTQGRSIAGKLSADKAKENLPKEVRQRAYLKGFKTPKKLANPETEKDAGEKENPGPAAKKHCPAPKEEDKREGHSQKKQPRVGDKNI